MTLKIIMLLISFLRPVSLPVQQYIETEMEMEVTAYCGCEKCCGQYADGITANGYVIRQGDKLIAAPQTFRFDTKIYIPGYGTSLVKDRGGAIKENRLDVYFSTHEEALKWGRRKLLVTIVRENENGEK